MIELPVIELPDLAATDAFGVRVASALHATNGGLVIALEGELGAGKTTLARATLTALGYTGVVVSPTYTLLESYPVAGRYLHHLDLYRLADPEELEFIGLRELDAHRDWFMIEWPAQGHGHLPVVDVRIELGYADAGRQALLHAQTRAGEAILEQLAATR